MCAAELCGCSRYISQKTYKIVRKEAEKFQQFFPAVFYDERSSLCLHDLVSAAALFFDASVFLIIGIVLSTVYDAFRVLVRLHKSN